MRTKRNELDKLGRAKPIQFARYSTAGIVIKTVRNQEPRNLLETLKKTMYVKRRQAGRLHFYDSSKTKMGLQSIENRLTDVFSRLDFDHFPHISDHHLRTSLKKSLNFTIIDPILQNGERNNSATTQATNQPHFASTTTLLRQRRRERELLCFDYNFVKCSCEKPAWVEGWFFLWVGRN